MADSDRGSDVSDREILAVFANVDEPRQVADELPITVENVGDRLQDRYEAVCSTGQTRPPPVRRGGSRATGTGRPRASSGRRGRSARGREWKHVAEPARRYAFDTKVECEVSRRRREATRRYRVRVG
ncbi:hypothetical protein ACFQPA_11150 [Halomarina halobia]|uniref:Uncharacterized protein n=1 Tax=Halomarina halobia TaxID=3033386 RepID=A0ABD6ABH0_9EURY|nr:hypothetical protein [Halomarina sp. PSR21]